MRVLLDTNVLIDYFVRRESFFEDAFRLRVMQEFGDIELWASIQSFSDICYVLRKEADARSLQDAFLASLSFLRVCSLDQKDLEAACRGKWPDLEDCLIEQCSHKLKAEFILSRDAQGFTHSSSTVLSPSEFFALVSQRFGLSYDSVCL